MLLYPKKFDDIHAIPYHHIQKLLGHSSGSKDITGRYAHTSLQTLLDSVNLVSEKLEEIKNGSKQATILPLKQG